MFQHLLVPLDGSKFGEQALAYAQSLAQHYHSQITLVHVLPADWEGEMRAEMPGAEAVSRQMEIIDTTNYLRQKEEALRQEGFQVTAVILQGEPVHRKILEAVTSEGADTLIMSTHGFTGIKRLMFGNVAEKVISRAMVPVLLIRPPDE